MDPTAIITLVTSIINRVWPDQSEAKKLEFASELQKAILEAGIQTGQMEVNKAEASNPSRKWLSWRELTGYICAFAVGWQFLIYPLLDWVAKLAGLNPPPPVNLDMGQLLFLLTGMLGLSMNKTYEKAKGLKGR